MSRDHAVHVEDRFERAVEHHVAGRLEEARLGYDEVLRLMPTHADAMENLGLILQGFKNFDQARSLLESAIELQPLNSSFHFNLGNLFLAQSSFQNAREAFIKSARIDPNRPKTWINLGLAFQGSGQHRKALRCFRLAMSKGGNPAKLQRRMASSRQALRQFPEALEHCKAALRFDEQYAPAWLQMGKLLHTTDTDFVQAERCVQRSLELDAQSAEAWYELGCIEHTLHKFEEAKNCYSNAVKLKPDFADAQSRLGIALINLGSITQARDVLLNCLEKNPLHTNAMSTLASIHETLGHHDEALELYIQAVRDNPASNLAHSNLLFCLNYHPDCAAEEIYKQYETWSNNIELPRLVEGGVFSNIPEPERKLKVGYVSGDFCAHVVRHFFMPILEHHNRSRFHVTCISQVRAFDQFTLQFKNIADDWIDAVEYTDTELADLILEKQIDILVDLSGHTGNNRLSVFFRHPAPIQISWMGGYGCTTGMRSMDYFLSDSHHCPPGTERYCSENLLLLDRIPYAWRPEDAMPDPGHLAAARNGHITFGCFSRTVRINYRVISTWAQILHRVPDSRLVLNQKVFLDPEVVQLFQGRFESHGICADRINCIYTNPQPETWKAYHDIDIALDPFPHNAGATTLEALWMGVPVISLAERPPLGRFGSMILHAIDMHTEWLATTEEDYIEIAVQLAGDIESLERNRSTLREKMKCSEILDEVAATRAFEESYYLAWKNWCEQQIGTTEIQQPEQPA